MTVVRVVWDGDVTLFAASLDRQEPLDHLLSPDELERADRFKFSQHRRRYVAGRGLLRSLLGQRMGIPPQDIEFTIGEYGKPGLADRPDIAFNVSHSGDLALFVFASECDIGVDVEHLRPLEPIPMSHSYFSRPECQELADLPPSRRLGAFFDGWVRKEAVIKADGRGMSLPLDSFSVRLVGWPQLYVPPPQPQPAIWEMRPVDVGSRARAAVAILRMSYEGAHHQPA